MDTAEQLQYQLTGIATAYVRFGQSQGGPNRNIEKGSGHEIPSLAMELLAIAIF